MSNSYFFELFKWCNDQVGEKPILLALAFFKMALALMPDNWNDLDFKLLFKEAQK